MKTFFLLAALIITQVLGDIGISHAMKTFGTVNPLDLPSLIPLFFFLLTNIWIWAAIFFLVCSLALYLTAISRLDLSYVLPIHAFSYVVNAVFASWLLGEQVAPLRWLSTFIISLGVLLVGLSKRPNSELKTPALAKISLKSRNIPLFLFPLGLSLSKTWLAVIVLSLADSAGDLLLALGMKKIGAIGKMNFSQILVVLRQIITNPTVLSGIACQAIAFVIFISVLSWADISFVRPATALTYISSMVGAKFLLKEEFGRERLFGITLIGFGVVIHQ
ncbi:MAG: hypothetical protein KA717_27755 [Woronichinia naegeliana WA131]|uniref:EamA domain-containing protein n=1 Tax=Woronichinia naegeliana WA131 TaxID=2824559 RepID=A0A977KW93_9CYAN|nr:MAG: hypothetical protein KA717_27755 [Woronichinia naegeliana WA131]